MRTVFVLINDLKRGKKLVETALITGASGGIGYELAKQFASHHFDLVLVARSEGALLDVKVELERLYGVKVKTIAMDLMPPDATNLLWERLGEMSTKVHVLVNNAGYGAYGPFAQREQEALLGMVDLNIRALTQLTRLALPAMIERGSGKILNVASTAAFQPGPLMAVYYATKAYVLSFTEAIASEVRDQGITVSALCPGPTHTGFGKRASFHPSLLFDRFGMDAEAVARVGYEGLMRGQTIVIPGIKNRLMTQSIRWFPRKLVTSIVRKLQEQR